MSQSARQTISSLLAQSSSSEVFSTVSNLKNESYFIFYKNIKPCITAWSNTGGTPTLPSPMIRQSPWTIKRGIKNYILLKERDVKIWPGKGLKKLATMKDILHQMHSVTLQQRNIPAIVKGGLVRLGESLHVIQSMRSWRVSIQHNQQCSEAKATQAPSSCSLQYTQFSQKKVAGCLL